MKQATRANPHEVKRRAPHGARGLKHFREVVTCKLKGRAPHGARGLKLLRYRENPL